MIGIIYALSVSVAFLAIAFVLVVLHYRKLVDDLMDRLMARDYTDYTVGVSLKDKKKVPLKRWAVTDGKAAMNEATH